ncbi:MAG TPA: UvrD-helicase domain-containing protein, partial [Treponemataceae bacterium]|nr:UvrD-helicase domain-containing protein [Treponemataceae bacterium]
MYHLIEQGLNSAQRAAVCQLKNCVVSAGAGSGKTFVLARRYAYLVIEKNIPVENILTLTFTNKAAAEMYQRIYKTLVEITTQANTGSDSHIRAQRAVADFHKARIQTIDSYCGTIVRRASRFYGIRPDFTIDQEEVARLTRTKAVPYVLKHRENKALQCLLQTGRIEDLAENLFVDSYVNHSNIANPADFSQFENAQRTEIKETWSNIVPNITENAQTVMSRCDTALSLKHEPATLAQLDAYFANSTSPTAKSMVEELLLWVTEIYAVYKLTLPRANSKKELAAVADGTSYRQNLLDVRDAYFDLTALVTYICNYPYIREVFPLIKEFHNLCDIKKRVSG